MSGYPPDERSDKHEAIRRRQAGGSSTNPNGRGLAGGFSLSALACPVRGCGDPLTLGPRGAACPRGHAFDRAKSGYLNLLTPQDRRAAHPGDGKAAVQARRRLADRGFDLPLFAALDDGITALGLPPRAAVLDVGCGEGTFLAALAAEHEIDATGVDLSSAALALAAKRLPAATWVVANADRRLPFLDGSFALVATLTSRRNPEEFRRLLTPRGILLVVLPGPVDLVELREAVLGRGERRERLPGALRELEGGFTTVATERVSWVVTPDADALTDLLTATYRGGRRARSERDLSPLVDRPLTMSRDVAWLRRR